MKGKISADDIHEEAERMGIGRKLMYSVADISKITGISKTTIASAAREGFLATAEPKGFTRIRQAKAEWIASWLS